MKRITILLTSMFCLTVITYCQGDSTTVKVPAGQATNLGSYFTGQRTADTAAVLRTLIALKLNIADSGSMLSPYLRSNIAAATYQPIITAGSIASSMLANSAVANLSGTNTGDNAANTTYANDYRAANFVAGTQYLSPSGNGSQLTGITESQVSNLTTDLAAKAPLASPALTGTATAVNITATGNVLSSGGGVGYTTGNGGTVSQPTSKSTGVTLNKLCGTITLNNAALAAATIVTFTVTNSTVAATDVIVVQHDSGGTTGAYTIAANTSASGSFKISVRNNTAGSLGEAIVIRFAVIKAVTN
jgi:hypothetical protein